MHFFICGTHTCGKTSIIKKLHEEAVITFGGDEIGKRLYYQRKTRTEQFNADFEAEVSQLELIRDRHVASSELGDVVALETWHPGNLAYAMSRNPDAMKNIIDAFKMSPLRHDIIGIWLRLENPKKTIAERTKTFSNDRDWASNFYSKMQDLISESLHKMDMFNRTIIISADGSFDAVYHDVHRTILSLQHGLK